MNDKQEDYLESQYLLFKVSIGRFMRNGKKFVNKQHQKQHSRLLRRIKFCFGDNT